MLGGNECERCFKKFKMLYSCGVFLIKVTALSSHNSSRRNNGPFLRNRQLGKSASDSSAVREQKKNSYYLLRQDHMPAVC
jgi:hypothetical protein